MQQGRRITIKCGDESRTFVLVYQPFPEVGDSVTWGGQAWTVKTSVATEVVMVIPRSQKVKVEIPGGAPDAK